MPDMPRALPTLAAVPPEAERFQRKVLLDVSKPWMPLGELAPLSHDAPSLPLVSAKPEYPRLAAVVKAPKDGPNEGTTLRPGIALGFVIWVIAVVPLDAEELSPAT
jgi:hypothetical protein